MKIQNSDIRRKDSDRRESINASASVEPVNHTFLEVLEQVAPSNREETRDLNLLWRDLPGIEKKLLATPNHKNLDEYKEHIKAITSLILKKNMKIQSYYKRKNEDTKVLSVIRIIDDNLQVLAGLIMDPGNAAFALMKRMTDIRGLLLDIKE